MKSFDGMKSASVVKSAARADAFEVLMKAFADAFGEDSVSVVGKDELAVAVGECTLGDGTVGEVCVTVKPVAKDFDRRVTESGKEFMPYARYEEADAYEEERAEKERKAAEKAAAKARK